MEPWLYSKLKENNMKQRQLAELLEIEEGTLSKKFNGVLPFTYSEVVMICEVLHIDNPLPYFPVKAKKETPAVAEPEFTVKCRENEVSAKPGVMVLKSDTIHLTGDQPSSLFAHSPDPHERYTQQSDRMCTERE